VNNAIRRKNEGKTKIKPQELEKFNSHRIYFHPRIHPYTQQKTTNIFQKPFKINVKKSKQKFKIKKIFYFFPFHRLLSS